MVVAEFLGTAILTLIVLAVSRSNVGIPYFVSFAAGLTLVVGVFALARVSGAVFNPAITIGLWSVGRLRTMKAVIFVVAQLLGGYVAYQVFAYLLGNTWTNAENVYNAKILVAEALGAFIFSFGVAAAMYQRVEGGAKAALIGGSLAVGIIAASAVSAGLLNPAVALGARQWVWSTYVAGPIVGAVIGFNLYSLLFAPADEVAARFGRGARLLKQPVAVPAVSPGTDDVASGKPAAKVASTAAKSTSKKVAKKPAKKTIKRK